METKLKRFRSPSPLQEETPSCSKKAKTEPDPLEAVWVNVTYPNIDRPGVFTTQTCLVYLALLPDIPQVKTHMLIYAHHSLANAEAAAGFSFVSAKPKKTKGAQIIRSTLQDFFPDQLILDIKGFLDNCERRRIPELWCAGGMEAFQSVLDALYTRSLTHISPPTRFHDIDHEDDETACAYAHWVARVAELFCTLGMQGNVNLWIWYHLSYLRCTYRPLAILWRLTRALDIKLFPITAEANKDNSRHALSLAQVSLYMLAHRLAAMYLDSNCTCLPEFLDEFNGFEDEFLIMLADAVRSKRYAMWCHRRQLLSKHRSPNFENSAHQALRLAQVALTAQAELTTNAIALQHPGSVLSSRTRESLGFSNLDIRKNEPMPINPDIVGSWWSLFVQELQEVQKLQKLQKLQKHATTSSVDCPHELVQICLLWRATNRIAKQPHDAMRVVLKDLKTHLPYWCPNSNERVSTLLRDIRKAYPVMDGRAPKELNQRPTAAHDAKNNTDEYWQLLRYLRPNQLDEWIATPLLMHDLLLVVCTENINAFDQKTFSARRTSSSVGTNQDMWVPRYRAWHNEGLAAVEDVCECCVLENHSPEKESQGIYIKPLEEACDTRPLTWKEAQAFYSNSLLSILDEAIQTSKTKSLEYCNFEIARFLMAILSQVQMSWFPAHDESWEMWYKIYHHVRDWSQTTCDSTFSVELTASLTDAIRKHLRAHWNFRKRLNVSDNDETEFGLDLAFYKRLCILSGEDPCDRDLKTQNPILQNVRASVWLYHQSTLSERECETSTARIESKTLEWRQWMVGQIVEFKYGSTPWGIGIVSSHEDETLIIHSLEGHNGVGLDVNTTTDIAPLGTRCYLGSLFYPRNIAKARHGKYIEPTSYSKQNEKQVKSILKRILERYVRKDVSLSPSPPSPIPTD